MIKQTLSVIFPAYNEEENLERTVEAAVSVLPRVASKWEIILVNDGSRDRTGVLCEVLAKQYPSVTYIHHPKNRGYGAALKSGIMAAQYDLVFFSDSDGQFDLAEIARLLAWGDQYDIVAGYRAHRQDSLHRLINAWGWRMLVKLVLGVPIRDIDCAFKLFHRHVFERIQIFSVGAMVNTEILSQAMRFKMRIKEVEVTHFPRLYGKQTGASPRVILKAFAELLKLWWKLRHVSEDQQGLYLSAEMGQNELSIRSDKVVG